VGLGKQERVLAATTTGTLQLETTRGKVEPLHAKGVEKTELNGDAVEVKQRGGWQRVLFPAPVLIELPARESGKE